MRHFSKEKNSKISSFFPKKNVLRFLSLRYSCDFRRSRLVLVNSSKVYQHLALLVYEVITKVNEFVN